LKGSNNTAVDEETTHKSVLQARGWMKTAMRANLARMRGLRRGQIRTKEKRRKGPHSESMGSEDKSEQQRQCLLGIKRENE